MNVSEEIRDGYLVTSQMKEVWQIQLDLVEKLLDVCKRHNLKIWAAGGTLLGAVRHKGYIPWDDDIDMAMLREDYDKLLDVSDKEFKYPLFLQSDKTESMYFRGHAQLRNSETTAILPGDIWRNINQGIFIDIFVLDRVPEDEEIQRQFIKEISILKDRLFTFVKGTFFCKRPINYFKKYLYFIINNPRETYLRLESIAKKYSNISSNFLGSVILYGPNLSSNLHDAEAYEDTVLLPFEDILVPVPKGYDKLLTTLYGDYMTPAKAPSMHGNVIFDTKRPYGVVLKELRKKAGIKSKLKHIFSFHK